MGRAPDTGGVRILWTNNATNATAIKVDRTTSLTNPNWTVLRANLPPAYETYYDTTAVAGQHYFYAVIAVDKTKTGIFQSKAAVSAKFIAGAYNGSNTIQYGVSAGPDPNENPTNIKLLTDANAKQIRIYSGTTFDISRDFGTTHTGKIYLRDTPFSGDTVNLLYNAMQRAKMYLANGVKVTLWIQLYTDRDKNGTKLAKGKTIGADGLRSPEEFKQWYATLAKAQISINDSTKVTDVINAFEIDNEPNLLKGQYWPNVSAKGTSQQQQIDNNINSYIDHDLVPAYSVFSKIGKTVIGAGLATGTATDYDELNGTDNPTGSRYLQYSMNCDLMNFHPYGTIGTTSTPDAKVQAFIGQMYKDPKVTNKFVITEFSVHDLLHNVVDIDPSDQTAAANFQRAAYISELNEAQNYLVNDPTAKKKLSTIYYFTLLTQKDDRDTHTDGVVYALPDSTTYQTTVFYDVFKDWAMGI